MTQTTTLPDRGGEGERGRERARETPTEMAREREREGGDPARVGKGTR